MLKVGDTVRVHSNNRKDSVLRSKYVGSDGVITNIRKNKIRVDFFDKRFENNQLVWKKSEIKKVYYKYGKPAYAIKRSHLVANVDNRN